MEWFLNPSFLLGSLAVLAVLVVVTTALRVLKKPKPDVFTEGTPLKLPRREGPHVRVPYNTEVNGIIELDGEKFYVTHVSHDFNPAGCQTYATLKPALIPPSRYEVLMEDE